MRLFGICLVPLFLASPAALAQSDAGGDNWQVPGEFQVPRDTWQVPGEIQDKLLKAYEEQEKEEE